MKILLGAILKLDFNSVSRGHCQEIIFVIGENPAYIIHAVHQRLMVGHKLKRDNSANTITLKDQHYGDELVTELSHIEVLPILECQVNPLYGGIKNAIYVIPDNNQFNARSYQKISSLGFYQPVIEKLEELQSKLNTEPEWKALAGQCIQTAHS